MMEILKNYNKYFSIITNEAVKLFFVAKQTLYSHSDFLIYSALKTWWIQTSTIIMRS